MVVMPTSAPTSATSNGAASAVPSGAAGAVPSGAAGAVPSGAASAVPNGAASAVPSGGASAASSGARLRWPRAHPSQSLQTQQRTALACQPSQNNSSANTSVQSGEFD